MPVLVVGADTTVGEAILEALLEGNGEVRAFVSDPVVGQALKDRHVKVAVGDLSDDSHVEGASTRVFCAVLITESVHDGRELAFASSSNTALAGWASALRASHVQRAIWVVDAETGAPKPAWADATPEYALITQEEASIQDIARQVAQLNDAASL